MSEYKVTGPGELETYPIGRVARIACCDCGLVHDHVFKLDTKNRRVPLLFMRTWRNNRATAAMRRHRDFERR